MPDLLFNTSWSSQPYKFQSEGLQSHGIWWQRLARLIWGRRSLIEQRYPTNKQEQ
jgi:hypothetical protein